MSDQRFAKWKYRENTGLRLDLDKPVGFNEKLWWLKLNNRDPLLTTCSDKVLVREYLKNQGLEHTLVPLVGAFDAPEDIPWEQLPNQAFIKTNHGSGTNAFWDRHRPFDQQAFVLKFRKALDRNYFFESREWNYKEISPKIVVEDVLQNSSGAPLMDYRFMCFDGHVKLIFVDCDTAAADGSHNPYARRNVYSPDYDLMPISAKREGFPPQLAPRPENFESMVAIAEKIAAPFVFCRVDLYNISGKVYFGETTFYPGGCTQIVKPPSWERRLGDWINLDSGKIHR